MKRILALVMSLLIAFSILPPTMANAAGRTCTHNYSTSYDGKKFESDICGKCGYMRVHYAPYAMPFVTRVDNVVAREAPGKSAKVVKQYVNAGTELQVTGRVRNEYNNLWLLLSDGSYIFSDNTAFDFDTMASNAIDEVIELADVCYLTYSPRYGLKRQCSFSKLGIYGSMFYHFRPGGTFDLKQSDRLGVDTYDYYVYVEGIIQDERYTGEDLGNILYGYVCKDIGISSKNTIKYAGFTETSSSSDMFACFFLDDLSRCDDEDDINMIKLGWNYKNTGDWE